MTNNQELTKPNESSQSDDIHQDDQVILEDCPQDQDKNNDNDEPHVEEDHDVIHARMVSIFRKLMLAFAIAILVITGLTVYFASLGIYVSIILIVIAIALPIFIYKISIKGIRYYPLD